MMRISGLALALVLGGSAYAWGAEPSKGVGATQAAECVTLDAFKKKFAEVSAAMMNLARATGQKPPKLPPAFDTFVKQSSARFHILEGIWLMNPATPPGLPDADGAILASTKGKDGGTVLFTKGDLVCGPPMEAPKILLDMLNHANIKDGADEGDVHL
jgi:hypothetical protein